MIETAVLGLLSYTCPNDGICTMKFSNKKELSDHLSENIIDGNGLKEFYNKFSPDLQVRRVRVTDLNKLGCIRCHEDMSRRAPKFLNVNDVFHAGCRIQAAFNNRRPFSGLSPCVAIYVVQQSIAYLHTCSSCARGTTLVQAWESDPTYAMMKASKEYDKVETQQQNYLEHATKYDGEEHSQTLQYMMELSKTYYEQGKWNNSEELISKVVARRLKTLGLEHPDTLVSMSMLASTYRQQERWKESEELECRVLQTRTETLTNEHPLTIESLGNLRICQQHIADQTCHAVRDTKKDLGDAYAM